MEERVANGVRRPGSPQGPSTGNPVRDTREMPPVREGQSPWGPNQTARGNTSDTYQAASPKDRFLAAFHANRPHFRRIPKMNSNNTTPRPSTNKVTFGDLSIMLKLAVVAAFISAFSVFAWIPWTLTDFTDKMETAGAKAKFDYFGINLDFLPDVPDGFFSHPVAIVIYVVVAVWLTNRMNKRNNNQSPANHS